MYPEADRIPNFKAVGMKTSTNIHLVADSDPYNFVFSSRYVARSSSAEIKRYKPGQVVTPPQTGGARLARRFYSLLVPAINFDFKEICPASDSH